MYTHVVHTHTHTSVRPAPSRVDMYICRHVYVHVHVYIYIYIYIYIYTYTHNMYMSRLLLRVETLVALLGVELRAAPVEDVHTGDAYIIIVCYSI